MSNIVIAQAQKLAQALSVAGEPQDLLATLKATAFKGNVTDSQMAALLIVSQQYGLNPWTKEIYAFPDKNNGIVPVVGVDGWSRIINSHPEFDGMDFEQDAESCTCIVYRKDRNHPIKVTEWMDECKRDGVGPWKSHPKRMLRHKAMIQAARLAFGFVGVFDQDEAERIVESTTKVIDTQTGEIKTFNLQEAIDAIDQCETIEGVDKEFQFFGAKAAEVKDRQGYAALRDHVRARREQLSAPASEGVEV